VLLAAGIFVCCFGTLSIILPMLIKGFLGFPNGSFSVQAEIGAFAIFVGILLLPPARLMLDTCLPRYLGRLSFSVYLLHWPVMVAAGAPFFLMASPLGIHVSASLTFVACLALTIGLAAFLSNISTHR
jgi:peptidoglycan/LPS O-acetylase OafA/YrhL